MLSLAVMLRSIGYRQRYLTTGASSSWRGHPLGRGAGHGDDEHTPGTGKWRELGVPHKGWQCIGIEDLEEPCHLCQMCEVQIVRYMHTMFHPDYGELEVGCICAGHMEQDLIGARLRETSFKQRLSRRMNWLRCRWRVHT